VLGNPPWERIKIQEKEWFATSGSRVANAPTAAARGRLIKRLQESNPSLHTAFMDDLRAAEAESQFIRTSGRYPLCGRGDVNTYTIFAELNRHLTGTRGRAGFIVPSGIATDDTTKHYFRDITEGNNLVSLYDFENRMAIFPGVHRSFKFALVTLTGSARPAAQAQFVFFAHQVADVLDPERRFTLTADDIKLLNPNTRTCPTFRTRRDAEITKGIYRRVPVLIDEETGENPWGVRLNAMFHMTNDSGLFHTRDDLEREGYRLNGNVLVRGAERFLPLYEAKLFHQFDHRFATFEPDGTRDVTHSEHADPEFEPIPRFWVASNEVDERLIRHGRDGAIEWTWNEPWFLAFRDITNSTNERTAIFTVIPRVAVGNNAPLAFIDSANVGDAFALAAAGTSFVFDFVTRQAVGGSHMNFFILKQLLFPSPTMFTDAERQFVTARATELIATSHVMAAALRVPAPFVWNEERRHRLRAELDAFFFHAYGVPRDDVEYILDTFPIVKRRDEEQYGTYRTKDTILVIYDDMTACDPAGSPYASPLEPPPSQHA